MAAIYQPTYQIIIIIIIIIRSEERLTLGT